MESSPTSRSVLHSKGKALIYKVNKYFLEEKNNRGPILPSSQAVARTAKATGVSEATVKTICSSYNKANKTELSPEEPTFHSPKKRRRLARYKL